ncbi:MAG: HlyD family secretion protein [Planctomycetota bacterium]|nr:HlyD family secretion protein [Planctomycetota bacterium]
MTSEPAKPSTEAPKPSNPASPAASVKSSIRLKKIFGRLFGISAVLCAFVLSFLTWWELDIRPRTDDAYLRANIVGIAANVSGYITELSVVDNQKVNIGDLLFRVDVRPYQAELDFALANLAYVDLEIQALKDAITQREADIVNAEAVALYNVQYLARIEPLLPKQFVTPDQVDAAKRNVRSSEAMVLQSKAALSQAKANLGQIGDVNVRRARAQATVVEKQLNVGYCEVRSSVNGYVTNFNTSVGQYAQMGEQVFALVDTSSWYLLANYQETDIRMIEPGMNVEVYLMAYPRIHFHGVVQGIGWALYDPNQGNNGVLPTVSPTLDWVRLAQRFPVRIVMDPSQDAHPYRMGATATAIVESNRRREVPDILKPLLPDALESWLNTLTTPPAPMPNSPGR